MIFAQSAEICWLIYSAIQKPAPIFKNLYEHKKKTIENVFLKIFFLLFALLVSLYRTTISYLPSLCFALFFQNGHNHFHIF